MSEKLEPTTVDFIAKNYDKVVVLFRRRFDDKRGRDVDVPANVIFTLKQDDMSDEEFVGLLALDEVDDGLPADEIAGALVLNRSNVQLFNTGEALKLMRDTRENLAG